MNLLTRFPRLRAALAVLRAGPPPGGMTLVDGARGGWLSLFNAGNWGTSHDTTTGSWQQDRHLTPERALAFFAVYSCVTQIASDIAKLCVELMQRAESGVWEEVEDPATVRQFFGKPNHYQTMQQFVESWFLSLLTRGNTVALKERDARGVVMREYVLDWDRVTPSVASDGSVWYQLAMDDLSHLPGAVVWVPASEVIHDRMNCLFHPLIGVSPLFAANLPAIQGLAMQKNSATFFKNLSRPGGVLSAPGRINDETAKRLQTTFDEEYRGVAGLGKTLVAGDGIQYQPMAVTPENAQLVEQLDLSARQVASAFKVPPFMIGIGDMPGFENVQALTQFYFDRCLQPLVEGFENSQDDGLALGKQYRTEFDLDDLLRMDSKTQAEVEGTLVQRGIRSPNEARRRFNDGPVPGGETPYLQQQNYGLAALAKRDASPDPFGTAKPPAPPPAPAPDPAASKSGEINLARLIISQGALQIHGQPAQTGR